MEINFHYDKKSVINALRFHFLNRTETKVIRVLFIVFFVLAMWAYLKEVVPYAVVVAVFLIIVIMTIVLWVVLPNSIYKKSRTFHESSIRLDYNEEGIAIGTHAGARRLPWESFDRVLETSSFFYLYKSGTSFFLIPLNAFENEPEREEFKEALHEHFNKYSVKPG